VKGGIIISNFKPLEENQVIRPIRGSIALLFIDLTNLGLDITTDITSLSVTDYCVND
jgi:hypothetical protein